MKALSDEELNQIFRKMSAEKKIKIVDDFYRFGRKLQKRVNPEVIIKLD